MRVLRAIFGECEFDYVLLQIWHTHTHTQTHTRTRTTTSLIKTTVFRHAHTNWTCTRQGGRRDLWRNPSRVNLNTKFNSWQLPTNENDKFQANLGNGLTIE